MLACLARLECMSRTLPALNLTNDLTVLVAMLEGDSEIVKKCNVFFFYHSSTWALKSTTLCSCGGYDIMSLSDATMSQTTHQQNIDV